MPPRVFNIPPSVPFLPTLIDALTGGKLGFPALSDPLALAAVTLYLPTRRACRLARDAFLDGLTTEAAILPRIVAIGDIDEDEIAFAEAAAGGLAAEALDLPPALGGLERRLLLTRLITEWARAPAVRGAEGIPLVAQTPTAACALADDLARLIDDMTMREVSWDALDGLVPDFSRPLLAAHAEISADRARDVAGDAERTRSDRASGAARRADQGGGGAPCQE